MLLDIEKIFDYLTKNIRILYIIPKFNCLSNAYQSFYINSNVFNNNFYANFAVT